MNNSVKVHSGLRILGALGLDQNGTDFPEDAGLGTIFLKDFDLYAYVRIAGMDTWYPLIRSASSSYLHTQGGENVVWTVQHNLGTENVWFEIQDQDGNELFPLSREAVDGNSFKLHFSEPCNGTVVVVGTEGIDVPAILSQLIKVGDKVVINSDSILIDGSRVLTVAEMSATSIYI